MTPCLIEINLPENRTFYNYDGSLTTPPLLESVIWTVFKQHITMSEEQVGCVLHFELKVFYCTLLDCPMSNNCS